LGGVNEVIVAMATADRQQLSCCDLLGGSIFTGVL